MSSSNKHNNIIGGTANLNINTGDRDTYSDGIVGIFYSKPFLDGCRKYLFDIYTLNTYGFEHFSIWAKYHAFKNTLCNTAPSESIIKDTIVGIHALAVSLESIIDLMCKLYLIARIKYNKTQIIGDEEKILASIEPLLRYCYNTNSSPIGVNNLLSCLDLERQFILNEHGYLLPVGFNDLPINNTSSQLFDPVGSLLGLFQTTITKHQSSTDHHT